MLPVTEVTIYGITAGRKKLCSDLEAIFKQTMLNACFGTLYSEKLFCDVDIVVGEIEGVNRHLLTLLTAIKHSIVQRDNVVVLLKTDSDNTLYGWRLIGGIWINLFGLKSEVNNENLSNRL